MSLTHRPIIFFDWDGTIADSMTLYRTSKCYFEAILVEKDQSVHLTDGMKTIFQSE